MFIRLIALTAFVLSNVIGNPLNLKDTKKPFTIEETVLGQLQVNSFLGQWISDKEIEFLDLKTRDVNVLSTIGEVKTVLKGSVLSKYNTTKFKFSPNRKLVLIQYDESKNFRHSETARYVVYSIDEKTYHDIANRQRLEVVEWGPKNNTLVYIQDNNIFVIFNVGDKKAETVQITTDGIPGRLYNGKGDWVYEEEILASGEAFWISPDGNELAYLSIDDNNVSSALFPSYGEPRSLANQYVDIVKIRYPKSGTKIPDYALWHVSLNPLSKPKLLTKKESGLEVFYELKWVNNDYVVYIQTNRVQNISQTFTQSVKNPKDRKMVFEHKNPVGWANFNLPFVSKKGDRMLRIEGRPAGKLGDFNHIILYPTNGSSYPLTGGQSEVIKIVHWDEAKKVVYYSATEEKSATATQIYSVSEKKDSKPVCLTCSVQTLEGNLCKSASASYSKNSSYVMITCNGPDPKTVFICKNQVPYSPSGVIDLNAKLRDQLKVKLLPEVMNLTVEVAGSFKADVRLFLPPNMDKSGKTKYPLLIYVYGGPASKNINDAFKMDWGQYISTNLSVIYGLIDGRNTLRKGGNMLYAGYRALGTFEMIDQINVTRYLQKTYPFIDSTRTGIWGWSYGGYATTKILEIDTSNVFKCGIAVAPVADWLYYDSMYTERYMGLPNENPKGYETSSVLKDVSNLRNKQYFLIHGNADDNVHYQNAMMIAKVLEKNNIPFESMSYPDEDHSLRGVKPHLYYTMSRFWKKCFDLK